MDISKQLVKAARMHAEGELERAKTNIMVYMNNVNWILWLRQVIESKC